MIGLVIADASGHVTDTFGLSWRAVSVKVPPSASTKSLCASLWQRRNTVGPLAPTGCQAGDAAEAEPAKAAEARQDASRKGAEKSAGTGNHFAPPRLFLAARALAVLLLRCASSLRVLPCFLCGFGGGLPGPTKVELAPPKALGGGLRRRPDTGRPPGRRASAGPVAGKAAAGAEVIDVGVEVEVAADQLLVGSDEDIAAVRGRPCRASPPLRCQQRHLALVPFVDVGLGRVGWTTPSSSRPAPSIAPGASTSSLLKMTRPSSLKGDGLGVGAFPDRGSFRRGMPSGRLHGSESWRAAVPPGRRRSRWRRSQPRRGRRIRLRRVGPVMLSREA